MLWRSSPAPAAASAARRRSPSRSTARACSASTSTSKRPRRPQRVRRGRRETKPTPIVSTSPTRPAMVALAETVHHDHGALDVLVNNAGVGMTRRVRCDVDRRLELDPLDQPGRRRPRLPRVRARRWSSAAAGHVVNVSSGLAYTPRATEPAYVTTKAAVLALSQSLRADWGMRRRRRHRDLSRGSSTRRSSKRPGSSASARQTAARHEEALPPGHAPEKVAEAIVRAIGREQGRRHRRPRVTRGWLLHRFGPLRLQERIARPTPSRRCLVAAPAIRRSSRGRGSPSPPTTARRIAGDGPRRPSRTARRPVALLDGEPSRVGRRRATALVAPVIASSSTITADTAGRRWAPTDVARTPGE